MSYVQVWKCLLEAGKTQTWELPVAYIFAISGASGLEFTRGGDGINGKVLLTGGQYRFDKSDRPLRVTNTSEYPIEFEIVLSDNNEFTWYDVARQDNYQTTTSKFVIDAYNTGDIIPIQIALPNPRRKRIKITYSVCIKNPPCCSVICGAGNIGQATDIFLTGTTETDVPFVVGGDKIFPVYFNPYEVAVPNEFGYSRASSDTGYTITDNRIVDDTHDVTYYTQSDVWVYFSIGCVTPSSPILFGGGYIVLTITEDF